MGMWGLSDEEWKRLKELQYEFNLRHSKIIEMMDKQEKNREWECDFCEGKCVCMLRQRKPSR
jgi:hypothetical protein